MKDEVEITRGSGNVFRDLGFDEEEAANLKLRSHLMMRLMRYVEDEGLTQEAAAERMGVHQPRVSALMRGKIDAFSIDARVGMLARVGIKVRVEFAQVAA